MGGRGGKGGAGAGPAGSRDKMAAPRRPRGDAQEEEEDEGRALEAKRLRGQRRLLVVLEGASLETVKVRVAAGKGGAGPSVPRMPSLPAHLSMLWP